MGVAGLWDVIRPAGKTRSLTELSVSEGFETNPDGVRGFRIGIDASIWFFHAEYGREGENPVLRTLFFRCATLMRSPFLPLFVFDGPKRPEWKRGKKIDRSGHKLIPGMKAIVEAFGFEWRTAPGEAEAELAYLNRIGVIDGVLSDDVDNFLFGATTVIRNPSNNLSGNRSNPVLNAAGKDDKNHTKVYCISEITDYPDIRLTRGGMILIGLMSGGDYHQGGLNRCGTKIAHGLAKCGFGDTLFQAAQSMTREQLKTFLIAWRHELCHELRTDSQGHVGKKHPSLANSVTSDFPDIDILLSYTNPITSESMGCPADTLRLTWSKEPDLGKLASTCEFYFEWGYKEAIIKRFRTVIWHSAVLRILRRAVLDLDEKSKVMTPPTTPRKAGKPARQAIGTPSKMIAKHFSSLHLNDGMDSKEDDDKRLIIKIHSERRHVSTDEILEYRLEIAPAQLVHLAQSGIKGIRSPEGPDEWADEDEEDEGGKGTKKPPPDPESHMRVWMPACMVHPVEPRLVEEYEAAQDAKRAKKAGKGPGKKTKADKDSPVVKPNRKTVSKPMAKATPKDDISDELGRETDEAGLSTSRIVRDLTKKKTAGVSKTDLKTFFVSTKLRAAPKAKASVPSFAFSAVETLVMANQVISVKEADDVVNSEANKASSQSSTISNTSLASQASVVRVLTGKKSRESNKLASLDAFLSSENPPLSRKVRPKSSKLKECVDVSSGEESDTPLDYQFMLSSHMKPKLAAWNHAPSGTYVPVSDSDDDICEYKPGLGFNDTFMYNSDDPLPCGSPSKPKQPRKKHVPISWSSDSGKCTSNGLHKSPRKSREHTSPRRGKGNAVAKPETRRSYSPCPAKVTHKADGAGVEKSIIDISDSDDEFPPAPRFQEPPLMLARARAKAKPGGKQTLDGFTKRLEKQKPLNVDLEHDILDLT
ncbi:Flap endonuclease GEN like protein [Termitomyces sp. T112]|nr:Flap endonuclease GEN like protein [Termitomyces sp. T112]